MLLIHKKIYIRIVTDIDHFLFRNNNWCPGEALRGMYHHFYRIPVDDHWYGGQCICFKPLCTLFDIRDHGRQVGLHR